MLSLRPEKESADVLFLLGLAAFFILYRLGSGSLASWDEAFYATAARDMIRTGNWLTMTVQGARWADKPPLAIWVTAFFYKILGIHELSARLFSALCGIGTVITTYFLGRELFGRWAGFLGAFVLLNSSHFFRVARFGVLDAPLAFFLTLSLFFFWIGRRRNGYLTLFGITFGLALMTKGYAAFLILPVTWLHAFWSGEREVLGRSTYWVALLVGVAIALPWHALQFLARPDAFMHDVIGQHFFARVTQSFEGHGGPLYFYVRTIVNKYHPWVLIALFSAPFFLCKALKERKSEFVFLSSWMFGLFAIISLVRTKLHWYIFPVYPALSLSVGWFLAKWLPEDRKKWVKFACVAAMAAHVPLSHLFTDTDRAADVKGVAPVVARTVPPSGIVHFYDYHEAPAGYFYLDRQNQYLDSVEELSERASEPGPLYVLVHEKNLGIIRQAASAAGLEDAGGFGTLRLLMKKGTS